MDNVFKKMGNSQNIIFLIGIVIYTICLFTITDIALLLFVTYVVACALNPLVDKLEKKCKRNIAAAIVFLGFIGGILLMFLPIIIIGGNEIANLAAQQPQYVDQVKDYIMNPKASGYRSYHMVVTVPVYLSDRIIDTKVEIQIRTVAMDFWASLEHKIQYKFEGKAPNHINSELHECAKMVADLDARMLSLNEEILAIEAGK